MGERVMGTLKTRKDGMKRVLAGLATLVLSEPIFAETLPSRIAVLPFESQTVSANGAIAGDLFDSIVVRVSSVAVVERRQLSKILGEQYLEEHGGVIDP